MTCEIIWCDLPTEAELAERDRFALVYWLILVGMFIYGWITK